MREEQDPYCYPGTDVLKNKLDIRDEEELFETEKVLSMLRLFELLKKPLEGNFGILFLSRYSKVTVQQILFWLRRLLLKLSVLLSQCTNIRYSPRA